MRPQLADGSFWAIPHRGEMLSLSNADPMVLLSYASGLAVELVNAGGLPLALGIAGVYLRLQSDEAAVPVSAMAHLRSARRSFPGVCLTDVVKIRVEGDRLDIPTKLIKSIRASAHTSWKLRGTVTVELLDTSVYKQVRLESPRLEFLTLLGRQRIDLSARAVTLSGHTVKDVAALRARLQSVLEAHRESVTKTVGPAVFERYFQRIA